MAKQLAIYLRVSSRKQDHRSQLPDLERWAAAQSQPVTWYRDTFTGRSMNRPGWSKLQAAIERGDVSTVICWRLDRLGRTARGLSHLFEDLRERGVGLISLKDGVDLSTPAGRMMAHVLGSLAQYESEIRIERVLAGQAAARAQGKHWGGRRKGAKIRLTDERVRTIRRMHRAGEAVTSIARVTGLSRPTVYKALQTAN